MEKSHRNAALPLEREETAPRPAHQLAPAATAATPSPRSDEECLTGRRLSKRSDGGRRSPRRKQPIIRPGMTLAEMEQLDLTEDLRDRPFSGIGPHNAEQVRRMEMISKRASGAFTAHANSFVGVVAGERPDSPHAMLPHSTAADLSAATSGSGVCCATATGDPHDSNDGTNAGVNSNDTPAGVGAASVVSDVSAVARDSISVPAAEVSALEVEVEVDEGGEGGTSESVEELQQQQERTEESAEQQEGTVAAAAAPQATATTGLKGGSLLRMFESSAFDAYLHMYYLYRRSEPGVQQYLVNMLYTKRSDADIHFYLPQLCCLSVERCRTSDLHRFLLARASKAMHIAVKVSWLFQSFADGTSPERDAHSQGLTQEVEMACINSTPFPPGSSAAAPQDDDQDQTVPDLFERRKVITKLQRSSARQQQHNQQLNSFRQQQQPPSSLPASTSAVSLESPPRTAAGASSDGTQHHLRTPNRSRSVAQLNGGSGGEEAESSSSSKHNTPASSGGRPPGHSQLRHRVRHGFVRSIAETTLAGSKIKLPSPYVKLGTPWSYSAFKDASLMDDELQPFIVKQRRCDYFNLLNTLSMMLSEASNLLSQEPDKSLRLPLLQRFLESLNEWMCCRRCVVAASEGIFAMTGLNIPLFEFGSLLPTGTAPHSTQIVRFLPQECKVLSSKKRAPFLLVYEVADLDEDLRRLPEFFRMGTADFERRSGGQADWNHLYVYRCILHELSQRNLYRPSGKLIDSPLAELQAALLPTCDRRSKDAHATPAVAAAPGTAATAAAGAKVTPRQSSPALEERKASEQQPEQQPQQQPSVLLEEPASAGESKKLAPPNNPTTPSDEGSEGPSRDASAASDILNPSDFVLPQGRRKQQHANRSKPTKSTNSHGKSGYGWTSVLGLGGGKHGVAPPVGIVEDGNNNSSSNSNNGRKRRSSKPKASPSELAANARKLRQQLWGKTWAEKKAQYRQESPYGYLKSWNMACVLVKGGDDLRQEMLASQLIRQFKLVFDAAGLPLYLRPYEILVTGHSCGIMVFVPDTVSIDSLKKAYGTDSLAEVFDAAFADNPYEAKKNFIQSHAAYSIIGYLLQVKDRHNGNYLLDCEGHIIHIDYGFMLSNCPGYFGWESSPFKLTTEFLDVMDGEFSDNYDYFRTLVVRGFLEARKHVDKFALLIEMMMSAHRMPCFTAGPDVTVAAFRERFLCHLTEQSCVNKIVDMIDISVNNWRSVHYDNFQRLTNGII